MKLLVYCALFLSAGFYCSAQPAARVDKKSKEFLVSGDTKAEYSIIGYQFPNMTTKKMICFSTSSSEVREYDHDCPLGAYFDTNHLKNGDAIYYLGMVGNFGKMNFIQGSGKKTLFYVSKSNFVIK